MKNSDMKPKQGTNPVQWSWLDEMLEEVEGSYTQYATVMELIMSDLWGECVSRSGLTNTIPLYLSESSYETLGHTHTHKQIYI